MTDIADFAEGKHFDELRVSVDSLMKSGLQTCLPEWKVRQLAFAGRITIDDFVDTAVHKTYGDVRLKDIA
jgi:hypothetical protein